MSWRAKLRDPDLYFRIAFAFVLCLTLVHLLALPLVVSYDGQDYARMANALFTPAFNAQWNFLRTPLFPLALKCVFAIGGEQPQVALLVMGLFGWGGVLLVGAIVRKVAGAGVAAAAMIVVAFYPILVGYQHMLLSETGIFFWLALLIWSLIVWEPSADRSWWRIPCTVALILTAGYYWRPTILYLSPLAALIFLLRVRIPFPQWKRGLAQALVIAVAPWVLAFPWMHITSKHIANIGEYTVETGMFKEILVPPDDPLLAPVRKEYEAVIQQDIRHGHLPIDGLSIAGRSDLINRFYAIYNQVGWKRLIAKYPWRYVKGAIKAIVYYLGVVPDHNRPDDENWFFSRYTFTLWPAGDSLDKTLFWNTSLVQFAPPPYNGGGLLGRMFYKLMHFYTALVLAASILSIAWLAVAIKRKQAVAFTLTAIPLAFLVLHGLTLMASDRYGFPVYPLVLANLVIVLTAIGKWARRFADAKLKLQRRPSLASL